MFKTGQNSKISGSATAPCAMRPPDRKGHKPSDALAWVVTGRVALAFGVNPEYLHSPTRGMANVALARQVSMYLLHVALGMTLARAGAAFDRDRTTAAHACRVVEDLRDNPAFDRQISELERFTQRARAGQFAMRDVLESTNMPHAAAGAVS
ncbi:helix-turn-helix domain-containing protein [Pseudovibrio exalbescens]|uniref:helix-turn-helix domain-containing protein n=1 Tax=Pseudovibrio exalbescens TaxID=197461 RepID=UPI000A61DFA6|nr:helix-turn-helix domain-containing protein [Pseudovibrio exalbescens]